MLMLMGHLCVSRTSRLNTEAIFSTVAGNTTVLALASKFLLRPHVQGTRDG